MISTILEYSPLVITILATYVIAALYFNIKFRGPRRSYQGLSLEGKVAVITGCSAGIGKQAAKVLAKHKCTVIFACRNQAKTEEVINEISNETGNKNLFYINLQLSNYKTVYEFAEQFHKRFDRLDILMNNAGVGMIPVQLNEQGHDEIFATNCLGHFLLTDLLSGLLTKTRESRVINITSAANTMVKSTPDYEKSLKGQNSTYAMNYAVSKYGNILFTLEMQERLQKRGIECKCVSVHPGGVRTEIWFKSSKRLYQKIMIGISAALFSPFLLSEEVGAWTQIYTALQPYEELVPGGYYERNQIWRLTNLVRKPEERQLFWQFCEKVLNIKTKL